MKPLLAMLLLVPPPLPAQPAGQAPATALGAPIALKVNGEEIDVDVGHAAPFVAPNFKGDGQSYLLVGQFGSGKLRLYPMTKNGNDYQLGKFEWFQAGGADGTVPTG
jgi:hypothetical protein